MLAIVLIGLGLILDYHSVGPDQPPLPKVIAERSEPVLQKKPSPEPKFTNEIETSEGTLVTRVVDGDTIEVEGGQRIRYIGIDTPETVHPNVKTECFGQAASAKNKELVEGKYIRLEKDTSETDKYGRLLRYVYLGDVFINDYLVREGFASASTYPPDIKHQREFKDSEAVARNNSKGLWGSCATEPNPQSTTTLDGCTIKGNISSSGEKIYHTQGQKYWSKTIVEEAKGEKYFCTEAEAQNSGFRKSQI